MRSFGKYRLLEPVATGGMAEVWRAEAPGAEGFVKEVALKLIRGDHDARGDFERMFIQEARLASRLTHANIVQVFEFDQVDGRYYIAMELVRGRTLREVVDRCREQGVRFGLARAVHVCAEVARALGYAHRLEDGGRLAGLVHRDVSPQNVLLSFEGEVKLTDFGIAHALGAAEVTAPGTVKGKLAYMAPEQARGEPVDARADVFAVGVMLWELCAGRRLFARETDAATLVALLAQEPLSPPSAWNEAVPRALDEIAMAALERDRARRTPSAEALGDALATSRLRLAGGHEDLDLRALMRRLWPEGATPAPRTALQPTLVREAPGTPVRVAEGTVPPEEQSTRTAVVARQGRRWWPVVAGALAAGMAVAGVAAWTARGKAATATATPAAIATPSPLTPALSPAGGEGGRASATPTARRVAKAGELEVRVAPWAMVEIDGAAAFEVVLHHTRRLPAGPHRLRASGPAGAAEAVVEVVPGRRVRWEPRLSR
ncbi:MAG TPA: serine/threonine-protein kinase [Anaeromyxobacteraceae bacterium]|nr:serine/threonine-protein kinase [Anaeromyxobacteraceae bacterium]